MKKLFLILFSLMISFNSYGDGDSSYSSSSKSIPPNAHPSGNSWNCNSGYERYNNGCRRPEVEEVTEIPLGVAAGYIETYQISRTGSTWGCKEGYIKSGNECKEDPLFSQEAIEREIAEFEAELAAELALEEVIYIDVEKTIHDPDPNNMKAQAEQLRKLEKDIQAEVVNWARIVKSVWNFSGAEDGWFVEVLVTQNKEGKVLNIELGKNNVGNSSQAKAFLNSVERAIYKSSPLPIPPDASVWYKNIRFTFTP